MKKIILIVTLCFFISKNAVVQGQVITEIPNMLNVEGNLLVKAPTITTSKAPTGAQTVTMVNGQLKELLYYDSTGRVYDPGGPSGNYLPGMSATYEIRSFGENNGIELTVETMGLGTGDSLIIKELVSPETLLAVGNGYNTTGKWVFNSSTLHVTFKSNGDANTGIGFSLLFKKKYGINGINHGMFFNVQKGAFQSGHLNNYATGNYSTALGNNTTASGIASTAIGNNTTASGIYSTAMGYQTTASGNYSTAMGKSVSTNNKSGAFIIGDNSTSTIMNAALDNNFRARFAGGYRLYTNSDYTTSAVLFANDNAWSTSSDKYSKEKFEDIDGEVFLKKIAAMKLTTWNYKTQDPQKFRHYGPMAQDFYAAFGKDKYGTIGNDSTINQADFDGINLIAIQALEKRTTQQKESMEQTIAALKKEMDVLKAMLLQQKKELDEHKAEKNPCNLISVNEKKE